MSRNILKALAEHSDLLLTKTLVSPSAATTTRTTLRIPLAQLVSALSPLLIDVASPDAIKRDVAIWDDCFSEKFTEYRTTGRVVRNFCEITAPPMGLMRPWIYLGNSPWNRIAPFVPNREPEHVRDAVIGCLHKTHGLQGVCDFISKQK